MFISICHLLSMWFSHSLTYIYIIIAYSVLGTLLGAGDSEMSKTNVLCHIILLSFSPTSLLTLSPSSPFISSFISSFIEYHHHHHHHLPKTQSRKPSSLKLFLPLYSNETCFLVYTLLDICLEHSNSKETGLIINRQWIYLLFNILCTN